MIFFFFVCHFFVLIGHHFLTRCMSKFIQTHCFYSSTFLLSTKQKWEKLKSFLSFDFSILSLFFILSLFHPSSQTNPTSLLELREREGEYLQVDSIILSLLSLQSKQVISELLKNKKRTWTKTDLDSISIFNFIWKLCAFLSPMCQILKFKLKLSFYLGEQKNK